MKIAVTGAGGMLGQDMVAAADAVHHEVAALTRETCDVTDYFAVERAFQRELPALVINCAAYTDVDGAETDEDEAFRINELGARNVAEAAAAVGARVIQISTDYVFNGRKRDPYIETDETGALGAYGRSKLAGEIAVAQANPRHLIVRTSWLYGLGGKNFVETMLTLATKQSEILVVKDQMGCPTYTRELADAVIAMADFEKLGVMHICGGGACTWFDFAREIFRQSQIDVKVLSGTTDMMGRPAPRPVYSAMVSERDDTPQLQRWDHGLHAYLLARTARESIERQATGEEAEIQS